MIHYLKQNVLLSIKNKNSPNMLLTSPSGITKLDTRAIDLDVQSYLQIYSKSVNIKSRKREKDYEQKK